MKHRIQGFADTREVRIDGNHIYPGLSQRLYNHSPDGFNWGYGGSGCAQLALAVLLYGGSKEDAMKYYQDFKWEVVSKLPFQQDFDIKIDISAWINEKKR